jgi:predicted component of type VI protein secretion system
LKQRTQRSRSTAQIGFGKVNTHVMPHIKCEGANFTLSLVGKLDAK